MGKFKSLDLLRNEFSLNNNHLANINKLIDGLIEWNQKVNLVGKSTLIDPIRSHILDSIQISNFINYKNSKIIDIGTGAGFPGLVLASYSFSNVCLVDSNIKKIRFLEYIKKELGLSVQIIYSKIENIHEKKFDYIVSRALASLNKLFFYSFKISHKKTKMIFLKGQKIQTEITEAKKFWNFNFIIKNSISDKRGKVILIKNLKKINV